MNHFINITISIYIDIKKSLDLAQEGNWETSHEIVQSNEGHPAYDRVHALLHRMEGDKFNARYWYSRIGENYPTISFEEEIDKLFAELASVKSNLK